MENLAISYHTFIFPFVWKTEEHITFDDFARVLSVGDRWIEKSWGKEEIPETENEEEWRLNYASFQYFTESANDAIFNSRGDSTVRNFVFAKNGKIVNKGKYKIFHPLRDEGPFELDIYRIRMNIYDAGIGILVFELENNKYGDLNSINQINERGRRINFPYFKQNGESHDIVADKIELWINGEKYSEEDFLKTSKEYCEQKESFHKKVSLNYVMRPIQKLLDGDGEDNGGIEITSHISHIDSSRTLFYIKPCVDDRMFVCTLIRNDKLSGKLKKWDKDAGEYSYLSESFLRKINMEEVDDSLTNEVYKTVFIEEGVTCPSAQMRHDLLNTVVYPRWIDWGTIHAITHHSMVCVTSMYEGIRDSVINPFLTEYIEMMILSVAERSVLLMLFDEASKISNGFNDDEEISEAQILQIEKLQAKYVRLYNQLLLTQVTVQEQGTEIYDKMREQLYIAKCISELDEKMSNLRDISAITNERLERASDAEKEKADQRFNIMLGIIGIFLAPVELAGVITKFLWGEDGPVLKFLGIMNQEQGHLALTFAFILLFIIFIFIFRPRNTGGKKK